MNEFEKLKNDKTVSTTRKAIGVLWGLLALLMLPEIAMANPIEDGLNWVLDLLTRGLARSAAVVAIAVLGYLAFAGRLTFDAAFKFILGIVFIFGGALLVDILIGVVS